MRISDVLNESQIEELNLGIADKSYRVGNVVGKGVRGLKTGWQNTQGAINAAKQGYKAGVAGIHGKNPYVNQEVPQGQMEPTSNPNPPSGAVPKQSVQPAQATPPGQAPSNTAPSVPKPRAATPPTINVPRVNGGVEGIKKAYGTLTPQERLELKHELEVIDDHDRIASGTNESKKEFYSNFLGKQI